MRFIAGPPPNDWAPVPTPTAVDYFTLMGVPMRRYSIVVRSRAYTPEAGGRTRVFAPAWALRLQREWPGEVAASDDTQRRVARYILATRDTDFLDVALSVARLGGAEAVMRMLHAR